MLTCACHIVHGLRPVCTLVELAAEESLPNYLVKGIESTQSYLFSDQTRILRLPLLVTLPPDVDFCGRDTQAHKVHCRLPCCPCAISTSELLKSVFYEEG